MTKKFDPRVFVDAALSSLARRVADARSKATGGKINSDNFALIMVISSRAQAEVFGDDVLRTDILADVEMAQLACPMDLFTLWRSEPEIFAMAMRGIRDNLNRKKGRFRKGYAPLFAL